MVCKSFLHGKLKHIRKSDVRLYHALVVASAFSLATAIGFWIHKFLPFQPHRSEVIGWISVNNYPKHQELFYYLLVLTGVPATILAYTFCWIIFSQYIAKWLCQPTVLLLKQNALASSFLLLTWHRIWDLNRNPLLGLILPVALVFIAKLGIIGWHIRKRGKPTLPVEANKRQQVYEHIVVKRKFDHPVFRIWKFLILPILIYSLIYSGNGSSTIDLFHEGEQLASLNELMHGGVPFRDIYLQHGLFQNVGLAWLGSKIFGASLAGVRKMSHFLEPLGYIAIYFLGTQLFRFGTIPSILLTLITTSEGNWVTARHSLALISFAWVANYLKTHHHNGLYAGWNPLNINTTTLSPWPHSIQTTGKHVLQKLQETLAYSMTFGWKLTVAGFFANFAFWYSTEIGLYALGSTSIFLLLYGIHREIPKRRQLLPIGCYSSGVLIGSLPILTYFIVHGALDDLATNTWIQCRYQIPTWGLRFPPLSSILKPLNNPMVQNQWLVFLKSEGFRWYLPIATFVVTSSYLAYRSTRGGFWNSESCNQLLLVLLGGVFFFRTALGRSDGSHLIFGSTFLWVIGILIIERGLDRLIRQKTGRLWGTILIAVLSISMTYYLHEAHHPIRAFKSRVNQFMNRSSELIAEHTILNRIGRENIQIDQAKHVARVVAYIQNHTQPNERIFDFTSQGAYYFFANRPSATRYHQIAYASTSDMQMEVIHDLKNDKTNLIIFKTGGWFDQIDGIPSEQRHPIIAEYLKEHYKLAINIGGTQILNRN